MAKVVADAGKAFDPKVVEILRRRYIELEKMANEQPLQAPPKLSTDIKVERGLAPDAGFAESAEADTKTFAPARNGPRRLQRRGSKGKQFSISLVGPDLLCALKTFCLCSRSG